MKTEGRSITVNVGPGEGSVVRVPGRQLYTRKVGGNHTGGAFSLFEVEVGAGGGEGAHIQHREDECFYVLKGRFEFLVEGVGIEAHTGSLVYVNKGELHAFENVGEETGKLLIFHTPGGAHERFIEEVGEPAAFGTAEEGSVPPTQGAPETGWFARFAVNYGIELVPSP